MPQQQQQGNVPAAAGSHVCVARQVEVAQHHHTRQQQRRGVGHVLACGWVQGRLAGLVWRLHGCTTTMQRCGGVARTLACRNESTAKPGCKLDDQWGGTACHKNAVLDCPCRAGCTPPPGAPAMSGAVPCTASISASPLAPAHRNNRVIGSVGSSEVTGEARVLTRWLNFGQPTGWCWNGRASEPGAEAAHRWHCSLQPAPRPLHLATLPLGVRPRPPRVCRPPWQLPHPRWHTSTSAHPPPRPPAPLTNVAAGCEAQAADEAGAQVGDDVAVQVGHAHHVKLAGPRDQLRAGEE